MTQYNIAFATDNNYLPFTFVAMQSIIDHISSNYKDCINDSINFHILADDNITTDIDTISRSFISRNKDIIAIDIKVYPIDTGDFALFKSWGGSKSTYSRLLLGSILDKQITTILYLDVDIVVLSDIRELFDSTNLSEHTLAASLDAFLSNEDRWNISSIDNYTLKSRSTYFNAGVLLINLEKWREHDIGRRCLELLAKTHLPYNDQDALNIIITNPIILPCRWNMQTASIFCSYKHSLLNSKHINRKNSSEYRSYFHNEKFAADIISAIQNPSIVHFTFFKPWQQYVFPEFNDAKLICNSYIYSLIERWVLCANNVVEFNNTLKYYSFDQWSHTNLRLMQIDNDIRHEVKARRKTRKQIISILVALFIIQLTITLLLILP